LQKNDFSESSFINLETKNSLEKKFSDVLNKKITLKKWYKPSENTFYMKFSGEKLAFHIVAVKMSPELQFSVLPEDTRTEVFAKINNSTIAINGTPYIKSPLSPTGIVIENQVELSPPEKKYSAFVIDMENVPNIIQNQFVIEAENTKIALGGFYTIIKDGKHFGSYIDNQDSRTAIGISKEKDRIFLLVVEGEFFGISHGLSYKDCGAILLEIDVYDAIQMDGGGSTSLYIAKKNALSYKTLRKNAINFSIIDEP
jgi:exopolysaccharide biosynthesis protein